MRTLINYLRRCFCKHEFEFIKEVRVYENIHFSRPHTVRRTYMCNKCGYVKQIKL